MKRDWNLQAQAVRATIRAAVVCAALPALLAAPALAAVKETRSFNSDRLVVRNLIGEVRVESHRGSGFEVLVEVKGADAADGLVELDTDDETLNIRFPAASEFVYPELGRSSTKLQARDSDWLSKVGASGRIEVKGSGSGLELWADVVIRAPQGHELRVRHAVGRLIANDTDGDLELSTQTGDVTLDGTRGRLQVSTGSGDVGVTRVEGERAEIATGSGDVEISDVAVQRFDVATGSGDVKVIRLEGRRLHVATGSGDIGASEISAEEGQFATGSGEVSASLSRMGDGEFSFATGSGDIVVTLPRNASVEVHAETDDGEIEVALDAEAHYAVREDDEVRLTVGGGDAKVSLGTGTGDIRIRN